MARWKKPKPPKPIKVKRQKEPTGCECDLCGYEMSEEQAMNEARYHMSARPCLIPGWEAVWSVSENKTAMPVVWGHTLVQSCPTCNPELAAYRAIIDALMRDEGTEPVEGIMCGPPLTWTEAESMMAANTAGAACNVTIHEGWLLNAPDEEGEAA